MDFFFIQKSSFFMTKKLEFLLFDDFQSLHTQLRMKTCFFNGFFAFDRQNRAGKSIKNEKLKILSFLVIDFSYAIPKQQSFRL